MMIARLDVESGVRQQIIEQITTVLGEDQTLILLFGSSVSGEATPRSDIDVALDHVKGITDEQFLELQQRLDLNVDTLRQIDLVELSKMDINFLVAALRGAQIWHVGKEYARNWFKRNVPLQS